MQTFLPYASFRQSARVLDYRRLGKQRVEAKQLLQIIRNETQTKGWRNHPATKMWQNHPYALAQYGKIICIEWRSRGYKDTLLEYFMDRIPQNKTTVYPSWLGDVNFHVAHQSNLLRKNIEYYRPYFIDVPTTLPYVWPVST